MSHKLLLFILIYFPCSLFCGHDDVYAFVTNTQADTVSAFNTEEEGNLSEVLYYGSSYTISVGENPKYLATSSDGKYVYVVNQGNGINNGTVSIIDVVNIDTPPVSITVGVNPNNIVITDNFAFVPNRGSNTVTAIDTTTFVTQDIIVEETPSFVAKNIAEQYIYVSNKASNSVSVINSSTLVVDYIINIPQYAGLDAAPEFITFDTNDTAYVANTGSPTISTIPFPITSATNIRLNTPTARANFIAVYDNFAYICCSNTHQVLVINPASPTDPPILLPRDREPTFLIFSATLPIDAFIVYNGADNVSVNAPGSTVVFPIIIVERNPTMIARKPTSNFAYVPNSGDDSVTVIDMEAKSVISRIEVGSSPYYVAFASMAGFHNTISVSAKGTTSNKFLTQTEFTNKIAWNAADDETEITKYSVYRDSVFIGSILKGSPYVMDSHNSKEGKTYSYSVIGQNTTGDTLAFGYITIFTK